jgi:2-polyprenyl-3-methyl-5-hydroxy-6-metoxy-1,4-benzoquinol methylase
VSKIFDCFLFCDEFDALEIRLTELDPIVDCFVLCEMERTLSNDSRPLLFLSQRERFASFLPKIRHVVVTEFPDNAETASERAAFQWNALEQGLADCSPDDTVIVSRVDEVPSRDAIQAFEGPISGLAMRNFGFYLNYENVSGPKSRQVRSVMCRYEYLRSPGWLRDFGKANNVANKIVANGGWRFGHLGDVAWLARKSRKLPVEVRSDPEQIRARIEAGDLRFGHDEVWQLVPVDATLPDGLSARRNEYRGLLGTVPQAQPAASTQLPIYYEHERPEVMEMVPNVSRRILELGCASGMLGAALKRRQDCHFTGVESCEEPARRARARLDRVIVADCEALDPDALFEPQEFDCLIAADVLEHLRDPEALLRRLQVCLAPEASIVVSIPNVRHAGVLQGAVEGYWTYRKDGILDRTHLRFFTRREIFDMFTRLGFEVEECRAVVDPVRSQWDELGRPTLPVFGPLMICGLNENELKEFFVIQWLVRARSAVRSRTSLQDAPPTNGVRDDQSDIIGWDMAGALPTMTMSRNGFEEEHGPLAGAYLKLSMEHESQMAQYRTEILTLQLKISGLAEEFSVAERENAALTSSTSWRLTRPLRQVGNGRRFLSSPARRLVNAGAQARKIAAGALSARNGRSRPSDTHLQMSRGSHASHTISARALADIIRQLRAAVPTEAVLLISDTTSDQIVRTCGRRCWILPEELSGTGEAAVTDGLATIARFESLRYRGADFYLTAGPSSDQLEASGAFRRHVSENYRLLTRLGDDGKLYSLREGPTRLATLDARPLDALALIHPETEDELAVLDWHTGLDLATRYPQYKVFAPPESCTVLPYLDHTVDVVVVRDPGSETIAEARRVARGGVVTLDSTPDRPGEISDARLELLPTSSSCVISPLPLISLLVCAPSDETAARSQVAALLQFLPAGLRGEIIVASNAVSDDAFQTVSREQHRKPGIRMIRGDIRTAAGAAQGDVLLFLSEGTIPLPDCVVMLLRTLQRFPEAGVVCGRVVNPDGSLSEAGGVYANGCLELIGAGSPEPDDPAFGFVRDVDWCSRTMLGTWRRVFEQSGGFDASYAAGHIQDADYCLRLRQAGRRVVYQPASVALSVERTSGMISDAKETELFSERWANTQDSRV